LDDVTLTAVALGQTFHDEVIRGRVTIDGEICKLVEFNSLLDNFASRFPVVTPLQINRCCPGKEQRLICGIRS